MSLQVQPGSAVTARIVPNYSLYRKHHSSFSRRLRSAMVYGDTLRMSRVLVLPLVVNIWNSNSG